MRYESTHVMIQIPKWHKGQGTKKVIFYSYMNQDSNITKEMIIYGPFLWNAHPVNVHIYLAHMVHFRKIEKGLSPIFQTHAKANHQRQKEKNDNICYAYQ